jgi:outer membrane protein, heavy metal efflux system
MICSYRTLARLRLLLAVTVVLADAARGAEPPPLSLSAVAEAAQSARAEIAAARARADALAQRPAIVGALDDPIVSPSIDHYPFEMMPEEEAGGGRRYDWSVTVEQSIPLSGVRGRRREVARAEAARAGADADRLTLDVALEAQRAFFMLRERRRMTAVLDQQAALARQLVASASSRYGAGVAPQADVLRSEVELARVNAAQRALQAETRAAQAMLNVATGRPPTEPIGPLEESAPSIVPTPAMALRAIADTRPELRVGAAEIDRATAEIEVMQSMYRPMLMVRAGRATTMAEGPGAMLMLGVSVPLWRDKLRAGVAEARAMERMAQADLLAMRRMIEGEIAAAYAQDEAAFERLRALEADVMPRAQAALDAAFAAYAAGQASLVTPIEAARAFWDLRNEQVMAESAALEARARLQRAIGRTTSPGMAP